MLGMDGIFAMLWHIETNFAILKKITYLSIYIYIEGLSSTTPSIVYNPVNSSQSLILKDVAQ